MAEAAAVWMPLGGALLSVMAIAFVSQWARELMG